MRGPLTETQMARFARDGFLVVPRVFPTSAVAQLAAAFGRLVDLAARVDQADAPTGTARFVTDPGDPPRIHRVVWCAGADPTLDRLGRHPRLVAIAAQLLGSPVLDQLISQAHFKHPGDGVAFPWHQDCAHRRHGTPAWTDADGKGSFVELALAVDPVGPDNGPLRFLPGSHRAGPRPYDPDTRTLAPEHVDPRGAVAPNLMPGDLVAFGAFTVHGSEANTGDRPRRMFLNGFALPGANHRPYPGAGLGRRVVLDARRPQASAPPAVKLAG
jgi:hypothetical protein